MIEDLLKSLEEDGFKIKIIKKWYYTLEYYNIFKKDVMDRTFDEPRLRLWYLGYMIGREKK